MKEYKKPELKQVELVADQAVLSACKTGDTSYGFLSNGCCPSMGLACSGNAS